MSARNIGQKRVFAKVPTTTAMEIAPALNNRTTLIIQNVGTADVFIGGPNVTATTGYRIKPNEVFEDNASSDGWYAIVASGTGDLRIIEVTG